MRRAIIAALSCVTAAAVCLLPVSVGATTRNLERLQQFAAGVEGYYQSRDRCYYHPSLDPVMAKFDAFQSQQNGYLWETIREKVAPSIQMAINVRRTYEADTTPAGDQALCQTVSIFIGFVLVASMSLTGPIPKVMDEMERLSRGEGRVK